MCGGFWGENMTLYDIYWQRNKENLGLELKKYQVRFDPGSVFYRKTGATCYNFQRKFFS